MKRDVRGHLPAHLNARERSAWKTIAIPFEILMMAAVEMGRRDALELAPAKPTFQDVGDRTRSDCGRRTNGNGA
jgi:hypothetical protein